MEELQSPSSVWSYSFCFQTRAAGKDVYTDLLEVGAEICSKWSVLQHQAEIEKPEHCTCSLLSARGTGGNQRKSWEWGTVTSSVLLKHSGKTFLLQLVLCISLWIQERRKLMVFSLPSPPDYNSMQHNVCKMQCLKVLYKYACEITLD